MPEDNGYRWEDEGGSIFDDEDDEPFCLCGYPCEECPDDCEVCDCDTQFEQYYDEL